MASKKVIVKSRPSKSTSAKGKVSKPTTPIKKSADSTVGAAVSLQPAKRSPKDEIMPSAIKETKAEIKSLPPPSQPRISIAQKLNSDPETILSDCTIYKRLSLSENVVFQKLIDHVDQSREVIPALFGGWHSQILTPSSLSQEERMQKLQSSGGKPHYLSKTLVLTPDGTLGRIIEEKRAVGDDTLHKTKTATAKPFACIVEIEYINMFRHLSDVVRVARRVRKSDLPLDPRVLCLWIVVHIRKESGSWFETEQWINEPQTLHEFIWPDYVIDSSEILNNEGLELIRSRAVKDSDQTLLQGLCLNPKWTSLSEVLDYLRKELDLACADDAAHEWNAELEGLI
ncbi:MAG: hypothetical protein EOP06_02805 [Proteobacteria bacterium]|nr:MAG: hypothetical protein EOP06_02805 [Pseudomonadota bacterium]